MLVREVFQTRNILHILCYTGIVVVGRSMIA